MNRAAARRMIDAIERTPLAMPMALLTAAAAAFLAFAVPAAIAARALAATGIGPLAAAATPFGAEARAVLMLAFAGLAGGAVWWLFHRLEQPARPADPIDIDIDLFAPAAEVPAPQLRRADAHPDAPPRRPLFAASDLGAPLDDVDAGRLPFGRAPLFDVPARDGERADRDGADVLLLDERYASLPEAPPAPAVADESIAGLMARLERGLERRGDGGAVPAAGDDDGLRLALEELRRMTGR